MKRKSPFNYEDQMLELKQVLELIDKAIKNHKQLSLVRFGHLELAYLGWEYFPNWVKIMKQFSAYSGVTVSSQRVREDLYKSLKLARIVGLHKSQGLWEDRKTTRLTHKLLKRIKFQPKRICSAYITHEMIHNKRFWTLLKNKKVALVGRRARESRSFFIKKGIEVICTMGLEGYQEIDIVYHALKEKDWDIALFSAGIPAKVVAPLLAHETNKVVIDFGHALDKLIEGENYDYWKTWKKWKDTNNK